MIGVQDQLLGKSLVSIGSSVHLIVRDAQISIHSYIESHTNNKLIAIQLAEAKQVW